jgi:hypothetical protein
VERLTLLGVLFMRQVCSAASRCATHNAICGGICQSCQCCAEPRYRMVTIEPH